MMRWKRIPLLFLLAGAVATLWGMTSFLAIYLQAQPEDSPTQWDICPEGSPTCRFDRIQAAIDAAEEGSTLRIAPGTYTENLVIRKSIRLIGAGVDQVILRPVLPPPSPTSPLFAHISLGEPGVRPFQVWLQGFTLSGPGDPATKEPPWKIGIMGGSQQILLRDLAISGYWQGVFPAFTDTLQVENVTLSHNIEGLSAENRYGLTQIRNSQFLENFVGIRGIHFVATGSTFSGNQWGIISTFPSKWDYQGVLGWRLTPDWFRQSQVRISNSRFVGNENAGIYIEVFHAGSEPPEDLEVVKDVVELRGNVIRKTLDSVSLCKRRAVEEG